MKIVAYLPANLTVVPEVAREMEQLGLQGLLSYEVNHDPFPPLFLAAEHTRNVRLMTAITVAFARNPMTLATTAHDLNSYSRGRFTLGLGTQIKAHITRRFSMPWSNPVSRIREFVAALHAIWDCWYDDKPLKFEGQYYQHTLMTPVMTPTDITYGRPHIALAAVGPDMCRTAAEIADGIILHSFTTQDYIAQVISPQIEGALQKRGKKPDDFGVSLGPFIVTGESDAQVNELIQKTRERIAFYGSTPAYRPVLEHHGWGDLQGELLTLSKAGKWQEMGNLITEDILNTFAVVAPADELIAEIKKRYADKVDYLNIDLASLPSTIVPKLINQLT